MRFTLVGMTPASDDHGPSVKDDEVYESVRAGGASKSKAAAIANASARDSRETVGKRGGKAGSYDDWTVDELHERAAELDIEGRSSMNKDDLIEALRDGA
ncbi:Rho termination factor N-terminal domain-containing protein [soil metagenome]